MRGTRDGFALAETDFSLRREGDVLGLAQSGLPHLRVASLQDRRHRELAVEARRHAETIVGPSGGIVDDAFDALRRELASGWLAAIASGDPADAA